VDRSVALTPDGKVLATGSYDRTVKLWDVATGKEIATLRGHKDEVHAVAFSPDGKFLASASTDKTAKLWAMPSRRTDRKGPLTTGVARARISRAAVGLPFLQRGCP
jgi:WD40 repeat protein